MKIFLIIPLVMAIAPLLYVLLDIIIQIFALLLTWSNRNHLNEEVKTVHEKVVKNGDRD